MDFFVVMPLIRKVADIDEIYALGKELGRGGNAIVLADGTNTDSWHLFLPRLTRLI